MLEVIRGRDGEKLEGTIDAENEWTAEEGYPFKFNSTQMRNGYPQMDTDEAAVEGAPLLVCCPPTPESPLQLVMVRRR